MNNPASVISFLNGVIAYNPAIIAAISAIILVAIAASSAGEGKLIPKAAKAPATYAEAPAAKAAAIAAAALGSLAY